MKQTISEMSPIFVVGTPRSGTTLLASLLGCADSIYAPAPGETYFFPEVWARRKRFGCLQNRTQLHSALNHILNIYHLRKNFAFHNLVHRTLKASDVIETAMTLGGGYNGLYSAFTGLLAAAHGKRIYCDHTPKHIFFVPDIVKLFPNAKIIVCVRDPRDFLASYKNYWRHGVDPERTKRLYHPTITALLWRGSTALAIKHIRTRYRRNMVLIRYEDLVKSTPEELARITNFIGVSLSTNGFPVNEHNSSFDRPTTGIFSESIGHWKAHLTIEECLLAQLICRRHMKVLGYEPYSLHCSKIKLTGLAGSAPLSLLKILYTNRSMSGPLFSYILQRLDSLRTNVSYESILKK